MAEEQTFETERLRLRRFLPEDAETAHEALDKNPEIWRFDPGFARTLEQRRETNERFDLLWRQFGFGPAAAFCKETDAFIGQGGLNPYLFEHRDGTRTAEFEVMFKIARPYWRQGYATEIARFWAAHAFNELKLKQLITCPSARNNSAVALLRKLGCTIEPDWLEPDTVIGTLTPDALTRAGV